MPAASPLQPSHPQLAVSAAIFRDDRILLVRRARSPAKGFYSLPGGRHYLIMSFAARWRAGEPVLNDELDDFRWLAPDAIGDLKVTGGLQEVIRAARDLLRA